eukprot:357930-Chlamydomonas_euryale.AAC.4
MHQRGRPRCLLRGRQKGASGLGQCGLWLRRGCRHRRRCRCSSKLGAPAACCDAFGCEAPTP